MLGIESTTVFSFIIITLLLVIGYLSFMLIAKTDQANKLSFRLKKMMRSFNDLDEQAKIIVKTDLELNRTQEELDKRLSGLIALQKTSRLVSTTLDEQEIFHRLEQPLTQELGFEKCMIFMLDKSMNLRCRIESGFSKDEIIYILQRLSKEVGMFQELKNGHTFSSVSSPSAKKEKLIQIFDLEHFILTPILSQNGMVGIVFVGNRSDASAITEGDEELVSILANQIGQSLENAELFEQVYRSRQDLEIKVKERTQQLATALEEVKKISKMKSDFISAVSHELRTPLTSIKGYAALLMTGKIGDIPPAVKERLSKINKHSDNLVKLINDLLDISRIESGKVDLKFEFCDPTKMLENVQDLLTPQLKEKDLKLVLDLEEQFPKIKIDVSQFERVFINLVSNAIKFTPQKGTITIKGRHKENTASFIVSDTGIGIPENDLPKLFNEFYRVENEINMNVKGTGLGLSLAKHIVEAHGGKIWVSSKVNVGTSFHFQIPVKGPQDIKESV